MPRDVGVKYYGRRLAMPQEPTRLGRFVILGRLGEGGMGVVYSAYDPELDRRVALKLLRTGRNQDNTRAVQRLHREAQALARLSHPNVVPIYDVGVIDAQVFIVMEFVVGTSLRQWVRRDERSWREVLDAYLQAGRGLSAAHRVDLVHRDFKPENVQVGEDGRIRVLDFGLARSRRHRDDSLDSVERSGEEPTAARAISGRGALDRVAKSAERPARRTPIGSPGTDDTLDAASFDDTLDAASAERADVDAWFAKDEPTPLPDDVTVLKEDRPRGGGVELHDAKTLENDGSVDATGRESARLPANKRLEMPLTVTGTLLGTPAFMSPEQFAVDAEVGPASDQFSFCLSLYEGLYEQRAFPGDTLQTLEQNVREGAVRPPPGHSRVPRWIWPILRRGLQTDPTDRHPSMAALLEQLERDPARVRKRWLLGALFLLLVVITGVSLWRSNAGRASVEVCTGAERELMGVWDGSRRDLVQRALAGTGLPYAQPAWQRISEGLDRYADRWTSMHRQACLAHQSGTQSGALLDLRMTCLARRRVALQSAVSVLAETDADSLDRAVDVVQKLPSIAYCADVEALAAEISPPEEPDVAAAVEDIRDEMSRALSLENGGRLAAANEHVTQLVERATPLGYQPVLAELHLQDGRIAIAESRLDAARTSLQRAVSAALTAGDQRTALEALARYIFALGTDQAGSREALALLLVAEPMARQLPDSTFVHALLLNNAGVVHRSAGDRAAAAETFERALAIKEAAGAAETSVELTAILINYALVTEEPARRTELLLQASRETEQALGPVHPRTLDYGLVRSHYLAPPAARALLHTTCEAYQRYHPGARRRIVDCLYSLAYAESELNASDRASTHYLRVAEIFPAGADGWLRDLARGHGLQHSGDHTGALEALDAALSALRKEPARWWLELRIAEAEYARGMSLLALGQTRAAIAALEWSQQAFQTNLAFSQTSTEGQRLARAQWQLASALWPTEPGPDVGPVRETQRERALSLIESADAWYARDEVGYQMQRSALARWRAQRGVDIPSGR